MKNLYGKKFELNIENLAKDNYYIQVRRIIINHLRKIFGKNG
jgi:hypothetical protein